MNLYECSYNLLQIFNNLHRFSIKPTSCLKSGAAPRPGPSTASSGTALDEFIRKTFNEWAATVDKESIKLLDSPLLCRSNEKIGMLDVNFDRLVHLLPSLINPSLVFVGLKNTLISRLRIVFFSCWKNSEQIKDFEALATIKHNLYWDEQC